MSSESIRIALQEAATLLDRFMSDDTQLNAIDQAASAIARTISAGNKVFSCGNGGSHCDAMHFAEELTGRYREDRPAYPAIAISDPSHLSCVSNDFGFEQVFARYLQALGQPGDLLLAISTSGNSANILAAIDHARKHGITVIALTGKDGGQIAPLADIEIRVPHFAYADRIQEIHIKIIHILIEQIEKQLQPA